MCRNPGRPHWFQALEDAIQPQLSAHFKTRVAWRACA